MNLKLLPWNDILDMADILIEKGLNEDEAIDQIADILDEMIDFADIFPNKGVGLIVEELDHTIFATAIKMAVALSKKDPEKRKARRDKLAKRLSGLKIVKLRKMNKGNILSSK